MFLPIFVGDTIYTWKFNITLEKVKMTKMSNQ